ncbi:MAG: hypothetical protein RIR26_2241 [Pseudomonadota bacterium]
MRGVEYAEVPIVSSLSLKFIVRSVQHARLFTDWFAFHETGLFSDDPVGRKVTIIIKKNKYSTAYKNVADDPNCCRCVPNGEQFDEEVCNCEAVGSHAAPRLL